MTEDARNKEERERIVRLAHERHDFVQLEDGFWTYWPTRDTMGAVAAHELRFLADELDRMNAPWQAQIDRDFGPGGKYFSGPEVSFNEVTEEESVCAQIQPSGENARSMRLGGSRYMCGKPYRHTGPHGDWRLVAQPEHAEALRTHRMPKMRFVRG